MDAIVRALGGSGLSGVPSATPTERAPEEKPLTIWHLMIFGIIGIFLLIFLVTHPSLAIALLINFFASSRRSNWSNGGGWSGGGLSGGFGGGFRRRGGSGGLLRFAGAVRRFRFGLWLFAVPLAVIVNVPAAALELQGRGRNQALHRSAALCMNGQRLIRKLLDGFKHVTTGIAFVFVKWHGPYAVPDSL